MIFEERMVLLILMNIVFDYIFHFLFKLFLLFVYLLPIFTRPLLNHIQLLGQLLGMPEVVCFFNHYCVLNLIIELFNKTTKSIADWTLLEIDLSSVYSFNFIHYYSEKDLFLFLRPGNITHLNWSLVVYLGECSEIAGCYKFIMRKRV